MRFNLFTIRTFGFPVMGEVGKVGIFILPIFENKMEGEIIHVNYNSKHHEKCKFVLKLMQLLTVFNLFSLEIVQKCQHCQFCVLREIFPK